MSTDPQQADFPEAKQFLRSHNHTSFNNKPKEPAPIPDEDLTRYFISSWDASEKRPQSMAEMVRSHWCCESRHWQRDACWREDKCLLHSPNAACAVAIVRATLQSLLRWSGQSSLPIVFENVAHDLSLGIGWLKSRHLHR